jgi:hypothetical protein
MDRRLSKALVAAVASALPLLVGCGGTQPPAPPAVAASAPSPTAGPSASTPTPTPTPKPSDENSTVENVSEEFVKTALTLDYDTGLGDSYATRVKPLMTQRGYTELSSALSGGAEQAQARFGKNARSNPQILSGTKVRTLSVDKATSTVEFKPRVQQRKDGKWKTIKAAVVDETAKLTLVKDGDRWLVDKFE